MYKRQGVLTDETYGVAVCSDHIVLINSDHEDDFNRSNSLMRTAMARDFSWTEAGGRYLSLYRSLLPA